MLTTFKRIVFVLFGCFGNLQAIVNEAESHDDLKTKATAITEQIQDVLAAEVGKDVAEHADVQAAVASAVDAILNVIKVAEEVHASLAPPATPPAQ
jgi:phosphosulfolactate phosphohydrolase-like enzyme